MKVIVCISWIIGFLAIHPTTFAQDNYKELYENCKQQREALAKDKDVAYQRLIYLITGKILENKEKFLNPEERFKPIRDKSGNTTNCNLYINEASFNENNPYDFDISLTWVAEGIWVSIYFYRQPVTDNDPNNPQSVMAGIIVNQYNFDFNTGKWSSGPHDCSAAHILKCLEEMNILTEKDSYDIMKQCFGTYIKVQALNSGLHFLISETSSSHPR